MIAMQCCMLWFSSYNDNNASFYYLSDKDLQNPWFTGLVKSPCILGFVYPLKYAQSYDWRS